MDEVVAVVVDDVVERMLVATVAVAVKGVVFDSFVHKSL